MPITNTPIRRSTPERNRMRVAFMVGSDLTGDLPCRDTFPGRRLCSRSRPNKLGRLAAHERGASLECHSGANKPCAEPKAGRDCELGDFAGAEERRGEIVH